MTTEDKKHNGWTNYETWLVALWLDNEQYYQERCNEMALEERDAYNLGKQIEEMLDADHPFHGDNASKENQMYAASFWSDLINSAMRDVNYFEIAEHYIDANPTEEVTDHA